MPLEISNFIEGLDTSWPLGGDKHIKGDDHLRLIKHVMKATFPGVNGNGIKEAIIATEQELNWLTGLTDNIQDQFDALASDISGLQGELSAPAGTSMLFYQTVPPNGWTQDTTKNDHMLRIVSASGGAAGGTDSPILNDKVPLHTHTATASSVGNHTHSYNKFVSGGRNNSGGGTDIGSGQTGGAGAHGHSINVHTNAGGGDWRPKYVDVIVAVKD